MNANVIAVSSNYHHTCAIRRASNIDSLWCWGSNTSGQLGDGTNSQRNYPVQVQGLPGASRIIAVATGEDFTCAIIQQAATQDSVWCWGSNLNGRLGSGTPTYGNHFAPEIVFGLAGGITAISAAADHACAISNGEVWCWGANPSGVFGDGTTIEQHTPVQVPGLATSTTAIATGRAHSCALTNGNVKCWGDNISGQVGDGTYTNRQFPVDISLPGGVLAIAAPGEGHSTCAILQDHTARCWGYNGSFQLGTGDTNNSSSPTPTPVVEADFIFYDSFGATDAG